MMERPILAAHVGAARRRVVLDSLAVGLPIALGGAAIAWRSSGVAASLAVAALALALVALAAARRARRFDRPWLIAQLDGRLPAFEDSSALLFRDTVPSDSLAALQRKRLEARIADAARADFRPPWSRRAIAWAWGLGLLLIAATVLWPEAERRLAAAAPPDGLASPPGAPRITRARLRIVPPAYTGLPAREQAALDVRAPEGSRVEWRFDIAPRPGSATLAFPEDGPVGLRRDGGRWTGARTVDRSMLYRVEAPGMMRQPLHRIDAMADAPPEVRLVQPQSLLVMFRPGQRRWTPVFEASDDYGVATTALLRVTVTEGEGENITFRQRSMPLAGRGDGRRKRYAPALDLAGEGLAPGGDLIVQVVVSDNRSPRPQVVEGPSVILRRPAEVALADGLDGMLQRAMPAYFRSQRQIIIDAEALIAQRRRIAPDQLLARSESLGSDQAILRQRYGQFMGEQAEGGGMALPTNDVPPAPALPTDDAAAAAPQPPAAEEHHENDGHDHGGEPEPAGPGGQIDVLQQYGHAHDTGDAATLFDPGTRTTLALALDAMWGSERELRQGRPEAALPFAHRALQFLKEAQQATRIYLPRVGSNLPPIDLSRRLTGEREGIVADGMTSGEPRPLDPVPAEAWRALEERPGRSAPLRLDALERWARGPARARLPDRLALLAAIDAVRTDPNCRDCRRRLRGLLWTAMERPPASVRRREAPRGAGRRYLDALR